MDMPDDPPMDQVNKGAILGAVELRGFFSFGARFVVVGIPKWGLHNGSSATRSASAPLDARRMTICGDAGDASVIGKS